MTTPSTEKESERTIPTDGLYEGKQETDKTSQQELGKNVQQDPQQGDKQAPSSGDVRDNEAERSPDTTALRYRQYLYEQVLSMAKVGRRSDKKDDIDQLAACYVVWSLDPKGIKLPPSKKGTEGTDDNGQYQPNVRGYVSKLHVLDDQTFDRIARTMQIEIGPEEREKIRSRKDSLVVFGLVMGAPEVIRVIFPIHRSLFAEGACWRCAVRPTKEAPLIKTCSRCNTAVYCSSECQADSWNIGHKEVCKVWAMTKANQ